MRRGGRRGRTTIWDFFEAMIARQVYAIAFGFLGMILASPLPREILNTVPPMKAVAGNYASIRLNAYVAIAYALVPIIRWFGFSLIAVAAGALLVCGRNRSYRALIRDHRANNVLAALMVAALVALAIHEPPRLPGRREAADIDARTHGQVNGDRSKPRSGTVLFSDGGDRRDQSSDVAGSFPKNGSADWGAEGQPIGGDLETLEIWDVTGSKEDKVIRIRSGLVIAMPGQLTEPYATIYVRAGQRVKLRLPKNVPFRVTAMAGTRWKSREDLFSGTVTTADFGSIMLTSTGPQVIAMGAPDQAASVVSNDRF